MLDLKLFVDKQDYVKKELERKGANVSKIGKLHKRALVRLNLIAKIELQQAELNKNSKELGFLAKEKGNSVEFRKAKKINKKIKKIINKVQKKQIKNNEEIHELLLGLPNLPHKNTPIGKSEAENSVRNENWIGKGKVFLDKSHDIIGAELGILDFKRAAKISGARFVIYRGEGALMMRALATFCIQESIKKGYTELTLPVIVNTNSLYGTGQLPKFSEDLFRLTTKDKWLIPTGEVSLTNYYADEVLDLKNPKMLSTHSLCFRSEAGAGGKDTKGIIRLHQFEKVELVKITSKETKDDEYEATLKDVRDLLAQLEIPYREVVLCSGDLGFASEYTTDFEIWFPSQKTFREISSVSMFGDFQARRAKIRYRDANKKNHYACTINGSGLALDRLLAAIIENYYDPATNTIIWPKKLVEYAARFSNTTPSQELKRITAEIQKIKPADVESDFKDKVDFSGE